LPRFAGLQLASEWGLSSEVEIVSPYIIAEALAKGASIVFTPTISTLDPLFDASYAYPRLKVLSGARDEFFALTRPLSSSVEEVQKLLEAAGSAKKVLSIAVGRLEDAHALIERFGGSVDAVELDVNLSWLLAGKDLLYVLELARELAETLSVPLALKVGIASLIRLDAVANSGASALILTPNLTYKIGRHFFRLHSSHISSTLLLGTAEDLTSVDISMACVLQVWQDPLANVIPLRLYDVTYALSLLGYQGGPRRTSIPPSWQAISRRLKVYARQGARYCPYGLIRGEGFVEGCNYCGTCLELNEPGLVELASIITP